MQCDEEQEEVRIVLGDTGEQIEDSVAQHIFEPFVMGDSSRNSKGGSGLQSALRYLQVRSGLPPAPHHIAFSSIWIFLFQHDAVR